MTRHYLFGPVRSRRLGLSLGIDLSPVKICSMSCIYCEVGRTTHCTTERREWVPTSAVLAQLESWLEYDGRADYLTFSGSGEPTMHTGLGEIIAWLKERTRIPIAVITNAAHLSDPEVRESLMMADVVLPSLDAVDEEIFQKVNRPAEGLTVRLILDGLREFRRNYMGEIWLEVMLCRGVNDGERHLGQLAIYLNSLRPDKIQINTPVRPGAESMAQPCPAETLERARVRFGPRAEIIASGGALPFQRHQRDGVRDDGEEERVHLESRIREHVLRRPATVEDLAVSLDAPQDQVREIAEAMVGLGVARIERRDGLDFVVHCAIRK